MPLLASASLRKLTDLGGYEVVPSRHRLLRKSFDKCPMTPLNRSSDKAVRVMVRDGGHRA